MSAPVVAIDGPAASGKSSTGAAVARELGYAHLDSGALYRGVARVALDLGAMDPETVLRTAEARGLMLVFDGEAFAVYLDGEPAEHRIRTPEVSAGASAVAAAPAVRAWVNERLRAIPKPDRPVVLDGRDIGTAVFPDALVKIYLTAEPAVRARRRLAQLGSAIDPLALARETASLTARDAADSSRAVAPLRQADDAILIDSSSLGFEEQVARIVALARAAALPPSAR